MTADEEQERLKRFYKRRHPDYMRLLPHWRFCAATYDGGRDWFAAGNIFRYIKEGEKEFSDRLQRAYRFNHTREAVDLVQKYIFKSAVSRNEGDASEEVKKFWRNVTRGGLDIDQFSALMAQKSSIFGRILVVVDNNKTDGVLSVADAKQADVGCYAYYIAPEDVLDVGYDEHGEMTWVVVREYDREDDDPINSAGEMEERVRVWTRTGWMLFLIVRGEDPNNPEDYRVVPMGGGAHNLNRVPAFFVDHVIGDGLYSSPALIADIAYLDRACANYLSNLDAIIQDQTFSQLAIPHQALQKEDDQYGKILEMGTKRIFVYDGEGGSKPEFLSPDPRQVQVVITVINKIINEIYHTIGMAGERTKQDNAVGIDNSSGVAKAYDFERMNSLLTSKADSLENAENRLVELVELWNGRKAPDPAEELVQYPDTFDVRSLFDEFTISKSLLDVSAPDMVRQEQMKQVVDKLFPRLEKELRDKMIEQIEKEWPADPVEEAAREAGAVAKAQNSVAPPAAKNPSTRKRQGQVTSATE